jgi:5-methylcytosine-specific restriction enzyme A
MMAKEPNWTKDETLLALELYLKSDTPPGKNSQEVIDLSNLLRSMRPEHAQKAPKYRNPVGVYMKLMNLRAHDPSLNVKGLSHSAGNEQSVWDEFGGDVERLQSTAFRIRDAVTSGHVTLTQVDEASNETYEDEAQEGKILTAMHHRRERNGKLVEKAKSERMAKTGKLCCEGCGFDFSKVYGLRGVGFIEAHHRIPLHEADVKGRNTKISDLALLCANCHRMIHRSKSWITVEELQNLIRNT